MLNSGEKIKSNEAHLCKKSKAKIMKKKWAYF